MKTVINYASGKPSDPLCGYSYVHNSSSWQPCQIGGGGGGGGGGETKEKRQEKKKKSSKCFSYSFHRVHHKMQKQTQKGSKEVQWNTQIQIRPPTRADELPFVDARYCKSLNSLIASRTSRHPEKQKHWNNPRSSYTSSGFIQLPDLRSLTFTEPAFWQPSWISYQTVDFVPSSKLTPAQSSFCIINYEVL